MRTSTTLLKIGYRALNRHTRQSVVRMWDKSVHTSEVYLTVTRGNLWSISKIKVFTSQTCTAILAMFHTPTVTAPQNTTSTVREFWLMEKQFLSKNTIAGWIPMRNEHFTVATSEVIAATLILQQFRAYYTVLICNCLRFGVPYFHLQCLCNPDVTEMSATIYQLPWVHISQHLNSCKSWISKNMLFKCQRQLK
jgi:hypothetical protein